jgi:hypothetical protein
LSGKKDILLDSWSINSALQNNLPLWTVEQRSKLKAREARTRRVCSATHDVSAPSFFPAPCSRCLRLRARPLLRVALSNVELLCWAGEVAVVRILGCATDNAARGPFFFCSRKQFCAPRHF